MDKTQTIPLIFVQFFNIFAQLFYWRYKKVEGVKGAQAALRREIGDYCWPRLSLEQQRKWKTTAEAINEKQELVGKKKWNAFWLFGECLTGNLEECSQEFTEHTWLALSNEETALWMKREEKAVGKQDRGYAYHLLLMELMKAFGVHPASDGQRNDAEQVVGLIYAGVNELFYE